MGKFFKWLAGIFGGNTIVTVGNGNTTTVSQTSEVKILKGRDPNGDYEYKLRPLSKEELSDIARRAVEDVAKMKLVTEGREERIRDWMKEDVERANAAVKTSPGPNAKPLKAEELKRAVTASKNRPPAPPAPPLSRVVSDDDSYRRRNDDAVFINTTTISDTYTHHTSSHSSSNDSYSSCDSSSSFSGSCD